MPASGGTGAPAGGNSSEGQTVPSSATGEDACGPNPAIRVVIASDCKRGHENQSRVLARMLGDLNPLVMRLRNPEGGVAEKLLRLRFALGGLHAVSQSEAARRVPQLLQPESPEEFRDFAADVGKRRADYRIFIISTGTPPATMNLLLARLLGAEPLCVMTPSALPRRLFRLAIVPEHDISQYKPNRANVITHPLALSYFDQLAAQFQARQLAAEFCLEEGREYWAVAIGGPSKSVAWDEDNFRREFTMLLAKAGDDQTRNLLITTSRRTPAGTTAWLRDSAAAAACFIDAANDSRNPLPAFFQLAAASAITDDSFSMVCEAIQAGFRPYLIASSKPNAKLLRRLSQLVRTGVIDSDASRPGWEYTVRGAPNVYYNQLHAEVRQRLDLD